MTSAAPDRPHHPGDGWVEDARGARYWGLFGAAGLLAYDPDRGVLLQHRVEWSPHGGTWALPGGALRDAAESPVEGAVREAQEEAGVPDGSVVPRAEHVFDAGVWRYTTVIADVVDPFEPVISDPESLELKWVPVDQIESYPLHPGFAASWPRLRELLTVRPALVIDAANVIGSVPDGWWRDRASAAEKLIARVDSALQAGLPGHALGLAADVWFPEISAVVEGQSNAVPDAHGVWVVRASGHGDDAIVTEAQRLTGAGYAVTAITSDRELARRVEALGAVVRPVTWLRDLL